MRFGKYRKLSQTEIEVNKHMEELFKNWGRRKKEESHVERPITR